jgi:hypothetical protein
MRRSLLLLGLIVAIVFPAAALAATLNTSKFGDLIEEGDKCASGAWYHFVNNQTATNAPPGTITTTFTSEQFPANAVGPTAVNRHVQHFYVWSQGTLTGASTTLGGKLVLSHIVCGKKDEPPF